MLSNKEKYAVAKENQDIFRDAIDNCMNGNLDALKATLNKFLSKNKSNTNDDFFGGFNSEGKTLIHIAASSGKIEIFNFAIESCSNSSNFVNLKDSNGFTPLINATVSESYPLMSKLLELGAEVNAKTNDGASAIHYASADGNIERMKLLHEAGATLEGKSLSGTPLHWAAGKGRSEAILFLLNKGVNVDITNDSGLPAVLMAAAASCDLGVKYLVEKGADLGHIVSGNLTTLHICAEHGLIEAVKSIVSTETGSKCCNIETTEGNKPIDLASMAGHESCVKSLLKYTILRFEDLEKMKETDDEKVVDEIVKKLMENGVEQLKEWELKHNPLNPGDNEKKIENELNSSKETQLSANPVEAEKWKKIGNEHYKKQEFSDAINAYTNAIRNDSNDPSFWSNRSACYMAVKDFNNAVKDAEICRRLNPKWSKGCYRLAVARLALNEFEDAAVAAFEGVKLDDSNKELKELLQKCVKLGQEDHKRKLIEQKLKQQANS